MDKDLRSIQQARELVHQARMAQEEFKDFSQEAVDRICAAMAEAGAREAERLAHMAHEETGFGRPDSKTLKNLFATRTLWERMRDMKTVGIIRKLEQQTIWEVATPMGVVAALIPSTNPTSTAMYKALISAKARCAIVMSPHPSAVRCTSEALRVVAEAAYAAGAPEGLFGCMTEIHLAGTNALLEHPDTDIILATGSTPMVRAAYSKGKPAYGVGSGNVPVYVDRSANLAKAAADILTGASFDWGTLCSTERSIVADLPIRDALIEELKKRGGYFMNEGEKNLLRRFILKDGHLNRAQVGKPPWKIAEMAGFHVPRNTLALIGETDRVGRDEPLSMETLSPILAFYTEDGWQLGCRRCVNILHFGGLGHTIGLHCKNERIIEAFALEKPAMRIVLNTVTALGAVGYTNRLFPSMTLGPGTLGGSITSDNISPMHLLNIKRVAFETNPLNTPDGRPIEQAKGVEVSPTRRPIHAGESSHWMEEIEARIRARAGNPPYPKKEQSKVRSTTLPLPDEQIEALIRRFRKS